MKKNFFSVIIYLIFFLIAVLIGGGGQLIVAGNNFSYHKVEQGENLYAISKKYCIGLNELILFNPEIKDYIINIGQTIKIPEVLIPEKNCNDTIIPAYRFPSNAILHEVKKSQTLYGISKMYDSINVEKLMRWNELKSDTLKTGQYLIVGWHAGQEENKISQKEFQKSINIPLRDDSSNGKMVIILTKEYEQQKTDNNMEKEEMTLATWLPKTSDDDNSLYALHKSLPSGTILKIRNPMNNEEVYVKVIGKLPNTGENNNLQIKISAYAASQLGILDSKFLVKLYYPSPGNQIAEKKTK